MSEFLIEKGILKEYTGPGGDVVVPDGVGAIYHRVFTGRADIETVTLPESVVLIGAEAFFHCWNLRQINLPDGLQVVCANAFSGCRSLAECVLPKGLKKLQAYAFSEMSYKWSFTLPEGLEEIGKGAFQSAYVKEVTVPASVTVLSEKAFAYCRSMEKAAVLGGEAKLAEDAFRGCWHLKKLELAPHITAVPYSALEGCKELQELIAPGVTEFVSAEDKPDLECLARIRAPLVSPKNAKGSNLRKGLILAYCENPEVYSPEIAAEYQKLLTSQRRYIEPIAQKENIRFALDFYAAQQPKPAKKPAKLSDQKKVELLEETVLKGTAGEVAEVFAQCGSFEFTARALGLACRYRDAEMVKTLLEKGATFRFEDTPALVRKYKCTLAINNYDSVKVDYKNWLFPQTRVPDYPAPADEPARREAVTEVLTAVLPAGEFEELLYYAAFHGDEGVYNVLQEKGITKFFSNRAKVLSGTLQHNQMYSTLRRMREEFQRKLWNSTGPELGKLLPRVLSGIDYPSLLFFASDIYQEGAEVFPQFCHEAVFPWLLEHTNFLDKVKPGHLLRGLVAAGNAEGLAYAFAQDWETGKNLKKLLQFAQEQNAHPGIIALILEEQNKNK